MFRCCSSWPNTTFQRRQQRRQQKRATLFDPSFPSSQRRWASGGNVGQNLSQRAGFTFEFRQRQRTKEFILRASKRVLVVVFFSARRRKKTEKPFPPAVVKTRATFNWWTKRKTAKTRGRFCVSVKLGNTPNTLESENGCKMRVNGPGAEKLGRKKNNPVNDGAINE